MLLGEKIRELRIGQGLSQESLAARLGVSRQAVSKWEKNLSYPDTENLLALAALFGVSSDELAGIRREERGGETWGAEEAPRKRRGRTPLVLAASAALLAGLLLAVMPAFRGETAAPDAAEPPVSAGITDGGSGENAVETLPPPCPTAEELGEFALIWEGEDRFEYLAVGQDIMPEPTFPFGTALQPTERERVYDTDFRVMKRHTVSCGPLQIEYLRITEDNAPVRDSLSRVSTVTGGCKTPRGIGVGSDRSQVLEQYGDELVYLLKESGDEILCVHEEKYAYAPADAGGAAVVFYMRDGHVAGLTVHAGDDRGSEAYRVDHLSVFPVKDGEPDFSHRREPEQEPVDGTRAVFIALYALENDANLSAEESYRHTNAVYANLHRMDWQEFGRMGEAGKEDQTREALLRWLIRRENLSVDQIEGLLLGACRSDLDGWMTDSYAIAMARAFVAYPEEYVRVLTGESFSDSDRGTVISLTGYGSDVPEDFHAEALAAMESLVNDPLRLSGEEWAWGEALRERLERGTP